MDREKWIRFLNNQLNNKKRLMLLSTFFWEERTEKLNINYLKTVLSFLKSNPDATIEGDKKDFVDKRLFKRMRTALDELENGRFMNNSYSRDVIDDSVKNIAAGRKLLISLCVWAGVGSALPICSICDEEPKVLVGIAGLVFTLSFISWLISDIIKDNRDLSYLKKIKEELMNNSQSVIPYTWENFTGTFFERSKEYNKRCKNGDYRLF